MYAVAASCDVGGVARARRKPATDSFRAETSLISWIGGYRGGVYVRCMDRVGEMKQAYAVDLQATNQLSALDPTDSEREYVLIEYLRRAGRS